MNTCTQLSLLTYNDILVSLLPTLLSDYLAQYFVAQHIVNRSLLCHLEFQSIPGKWHDNVTIPIISA